MPESRAARAPHAGVAPPGGAYVCLAASMALVGAYVGASKALVAVFPVALLAGLRFAIAAVAMAGWLRRRGAEPAVSFADRRLLFLQSLFGNVLFSLCMLTGVAWTSALSAGVVMAAIPAVVALLSWAFLREPIDARTLGAIALAALGIALLAWARAPAVTTAAAGAAREGWQPAAGHALLLGAVVCEAAYVVIGKRLSARVSPRRISAIINLWGLALVAPAAIWQARAFDFGAVDARSWLLLVAYALAASVATVWLWMKGLAHVPAPRAGVFTVVLPISAAVVGVAFLGERGGVAHALALALAVGGVLLATWRVGAAGRRPRNVGAG